MNGYEGNKLDRLTEWGWTDTDRHRCKERYEEMERQNTEVTWWEQRFSKQN